MKAAIVERPGVLAVCEIPEPQPGEYEVLCQHLFGSTCSGTDQHLIHGRFPSKVSYPTILGHETIGRVVRTGRKVRHFKEGDLITRSRTPPPPGSGLSANWGGFAERGTATDHIAMKEDGLPKSEWGRHTANQVVPPDIGPAAATMMITWRETLSYSRRMGVGEGARVLVMGSGGTALAFASHSRNLGAQRVAMTGNSSRASLARSAGATDYFDYKSQDLPGRISASCPDGFDFVIDSVGRAGLLDMALPLLDPGGTAAIYGIDEINDAAIHPVRARGTFTYYGGGYEEAEAHAEVIERIRDGSLVAGLWLDLTHPFALDEINAAFESVLRREIVKALVILSE